MLFRFTSDNERGAYGCVSAYAYVHINLSKEFTLEKSLGPGTTQHVLLSLA